jgi:hypothetical protein
MAILQALVALIGRSAGKILNAVFGWAVRALFGATSGREQTLLTALVAMAALWPLLLVGIVAPRIAAFVVAFVPLPQSVPESAVRIFWIVLAVVVPALVGVALAAKRPAGTRSESRLVRLLRGYPTTLALACAFWLSFVTVPIVRLVSIVRRRSDADVPLVTDARGYEDVAARIRRVLDAHGFTLEPREPPAWASAPMTVLRALGGSAFRDYVPRHVAHFVGPKLEVTLHPNSLLLRGPAGTLAYAQGLVVEALATADAFQTTLPEAQAIERQIRRVWQVLDENPPAHEHSRWLQSRLDDIVGDIATLEASYDEWQIVYRQALQLARALGGDAQLLARDDGGGTGMERLENDTGTRESGDWRRRPTLELVREVAAKTSALVGKEVELARTELKNDFAAEMATLKSLAVAAVAAVLTLNMLLVAAVFAVLPYMAGWLAALCVAGATLLVALVAGAIGWRHHVAHPLDRTRKTLTEDLRWAKEELA